MVFVNMKKLSMVLLACVGLSVTSDAKIKQVGKTIQLRPVNIKNVAYASNGKSFAIPNFVTAGSVAIFVVSEQGKVGWFRQFLPQRFVHTSGVFYYYPRKEQFPSMAFLPLQELLSGYSVSYSPSGDTLAVAETTKSFCSIQIPETNQTITIGNNTTRAVLRMDSFGG